MDGVGTDEARRRLCVFTKGFLTETRVRRILDLAGWDIRLGAPGPGDWVGVWGRSPYAPRGEKVAAWAEAPILRVEDTLLRSLHPGRAGEPPIGLTLDRTGVHFDGSVPSDLETLLATHPLDDTALLDRARDAAARIAHAHLTKYAAVDPNLPVPEPGYVLVIDQTEGDASVTYGGGNAALFREMLVFAQEEHPGARVVIKTHPETAGGHRSGYFSEADASPRISLIDAPVSPWRLFEGAVGVYTVSSGLGFEAIYAGHKPRVFGQPFYSGWGLTADENPVPRRERRLTRAQLFAAAMILYPTWYDPHRDRLCEVEDVIAGLETRARAWRADRRGYVASGMRLWKRGHLRRVFGAGGGIAFDDDPARAAGKAEALDRPLLVWAGKETPEHRAPEVIRVEDGVLRSRGLGAELVPPLALVSDDLGIYYDPTRESRLERLIAASPALPQAELRRAEALVRQITAARLTKYNLERLPPADLPDGHRILVPGQVEDDASVLKGCGEVRTNLALLEWARAANPGAVLLYKPHPDVEAGLRPGAIPRETALELADAVLEGTSAAGLLEEVGAVWTLTSTLGFEALLRGVPVTCLGVPFYAGWGLTSDLGAVPDRRGPGPVLAGVAHAVLIGYPRYFDPVTRSVCSPEVAVERLAKGEIPLPGPGNRVLSKLQGLFASYAPLWR